MKRDIKRLFPSGVPRHLRVFTTRFGHVDDVRVDLEGATIHDFFAHSIHALLSQYPENDFTRRIQALSFSLRRIDWFVLDALDNLDAWDSQRRAEEYAASISNLQQIIETMGLDDQEGRDLFSAFFQAVEEEAIV
ncbi:hypothetical protein LTR95_007299 [Oleoguttula sp. CCFEE 5521]